MVIPPYIRCPAGFRAGENGYIHLQMIDTVAHYIATQPIIDLCLEVEQRPRSRVIRQCWEQEGLDLTVLREAVGENRDR